MQKYADSLGIGVTTLQAQVTFLGRQLGDDTFPWGNYYTKAVGLDNLNGLTLEDATFRLYRYVLSPGSAYCVGPDGWLPGTAESEKKGSAPYKACCTQSQRKNGTCTVYNNEKPLGWGEVEKLLANPSARQKTYNAFVKRLANAKEALAMDVSSCSAGGSSSTNNSTSTNDSVSDDSSTPTPVLPDGDSDDHVLATATQATGLVGGQSAANAIAQTDDSVRNVQWLPSSTKYGKTIKESGCSLIAVSNAYGAVHKYNQKQTADFAIELASWTKTTSSEPSKAKTRKIIQHTEMTTTEIWSSYNDSYDKKLSAVRSALASGAAIVAGGARRADSEKKSDFCKSNGNINAGLCVFSKSGNNGVGGGHWIAIIGITSDDKLVIANPTYYLDRTWIYPAKAVLDRSNVGFMVK